MSDRAALLAVRVGLCLMVAVCVAGLFGEATAFERALFLLIAAISAYGLGILREF